MMLRAEKAGVPDTARWVRSRIELALNAAIAQGLRTATLINPAGCKLIAAAHSSKREGERPHYRAVKINEAQEVFRALKAEAGSPFGAWLFMVLTAARRRRRSKRVGPKSTSIADCGRSRRRG
jgi:hypothetical protein